MAVTVTLATTTLAAPASVTDQQIKLASTSGVLPGYRLYVDRELMAVTSLGVSPWVNVRRGVDTTATAPHTSGQVVTIGTADQFYSSDPVGVPPAAVPVSPYINVLTGDFWYAQGDELPAGNSNRWWQKRSTTYTAGALGVRVSTQDPTSST